MSIKFPQRGEIWWATADKRRPVVVVQSDFMNRSQIGWILAVPITSNLAFAGAPGNIRLTKRDSGLPKPSVANVSQVAPLPRIGFIERIRPLSPDRLEQIDEGLRLVLDL